MHSLFLCEASSLFQVGARAEARVDSAREHQGPRGTALTRHHRALLVAVGRVLGVDVVDLGPQRGEQGFRDGIARRRPVELEHADVARIRRRHVHDVDEGAGVAGIRSPHEAERGRRDETERRAERHREDVAQVKSLEEFGMGRLVRIWRMEKTGFVTLNYLRRGIIAVTRGIRRGLTSSAS